MANIEDKLPDNIEGRYFVDSECIDCDACREAAPQNFMRQQEEGYSYVYKQPEDKEEEEACKEAMEGCPVDAIGICCGSSCGCH